MAILSPDLTLKTTIILLGHTFNIIMCVWNCTSIVAPPGGGRWRPRPFSPTEISWMKTYLLKMPLLPSCIRVLCNFELNIIINLQNLLRKNSRSLVKWLNDRRCSNDASYEHSYDYCDDSVTFNKLCTLKNREIMVVNVFTGLKKINIVLK